MLPGEVSTIEIPRAQPDLGISIVGGCDTPLVSIVDEWPKNYQILSPGPVAQSAGLQISNLTSVEVSHEFQQSGHSREIISTTILSILLIQIGQLSVAIKRVQLALISLTA